VLMGADHLCALAVVAAPGEGSDSRSGESRDATKKHIKTFVSSLLLGLRWGIGHALGLVLVCVVFFSAKGSVDLDNVGDVADKIVGVSMVVLGLVSLLYLYRWRARVALEKRHLADALITSADTLEAHTEGRVLQSELKNRNLNDRYETVSIAVRPGSKEHERAHRNNFPHTHAESKDDDDAYEQTAREKKLGMREGTGKTMASHHTLEAEDVEVGMTPHDRGDHAGDGGRETETETETETDAEKTGTMRSRWSFLIGFTHGVASPSGILSVLPGVVLDDHGKASAYLIAFFVTSTTAMGVFAGVFGAAASLAQERAGRKSRFEKAKASDSDSRVTDAPTKVAMALNLFAGLAAVAIGVVWLVLSSLGKLGDL